MPAGIGDEALLGLLGDILQPEPDPHAASDLRLRLMRPGFSWQALVDLAAGQDVLLPLIFSLNARGLVPPAPRSTAGRNRHVAVQLGEVYRHHLERRQSEKAQLKEILSVVNGIGVAPLILKGARYLVEPAAPWSKARSMADFDILVRPDDAQRTVAALKAQGYREGDDYMPDYHHLPTLERHGEPNAVEIHIQALSVAGQAVMRTEHVWTHAVMGGGGSFFVMPLHWHALHGLLHHQVSDRGHVRRMLAIKPLWEWSMLARNFSRENWVAVTALMEAAGMTDVLGSWLAQSQRLFGLPMSAIADISPAAQRHAAATFRQAAKPHWLRRTGFIADQLRFAFARETLALRYRIPPSQVSPVQAREYVFHLLRRHRGRLLARLTGRSDRVS